jgi:hypothetical protein
MRNRAVRGSLIAVILVIVPAVGANSKEVRWHPPQKLTKQQTNPAEKENPPNPDKRGTAELPLVVRPLATEKTQQEAEEDTRDRNDKRWNDRATLVIGFATLLILIVQAIAFFVQAWRLQQTINTMKGLGREQREIGEAQVRAYVSIKAATIEFMLDAIHPCVRFIAYNSGQSPARNFVWNITLQYFGGKENRESRLHEAWIEQTGIDIPATIEYSDVGGLIPEMSVKQYIEEAVPGLMITVVRAKIGFRFTDVFDKDWFGEAFFGGTMQSRQVSPEDIQLGVSRWVAQIAPMAKPRDWDDVGKAKNTQSG